MKLRRILAVVASLWIMPHAVSAQGSEVGDSLRRESVPMSPGDVVRLRIWREPDLSGDFPVAVDGRVTFPKVGVIDASGMSPDTLRSRLIARYAEFLKNPSLEIVLLRRVKIVGAVRVPGLYTVDPTMTIGDAIALAGGASPDGRKHEVELLRSGRRVAVLRSRGDRIGDVRLRSGDELFVPERSWISRNPGIVASTITAGVSLMIAVFLR